ncbi:tRNA:m(4)X modification enzyme TRM13 homolog [Cydia splendana]|uniref:tRNA:m(4)X modification enzyme TRM13 homolog n=1 Tax=Cydia splendana TaxID=1100963 RepID=UPI0028F49FFB
MSGEEKTPAAAATPQCQFFVQRKKRLCRMTVKPGRQYCGEHQPQPNAGADQTDKRIPCPNDPKHTCYASKLLKHLAICNARRTEQPPYIVHNINAPEAVDTCPRLPLSSYPKDALANVIDKVNHLYAKHVEGHITAQPSQPIHRAVLPEFCEEDRAESSRRHLRQVSALLWAAERAGLATSRACYVELGAGKGQLCYYAAHAWCADTGSRVLAVDRAPLRHKRDNKLRSAPPTHTAPSDNATENRVSNLDLQDQKGNVGHEDNQLSEIDRIDAKKLSTPNKILKSDNISSTVSTEHSTNSKDNGNGEPLNKIINSEKISTKSEYSNVIGNSKDGEDGISTTESNDHNTANSNDGNGETDKSKESEVGVRIRADLAHLALQAVPVVMECEAVVGLAKHLCGVATDYALRCIAAPGVVSKTRGLVLATCCHHRIEQALYVANEPLKELGINAEEFNIMLGIVSWATCGDGRSRERRLLDPPQEGQETQRQGEAGRRHEEREEIGRRAKALFDWGRVVWLRARGFDARLCYYVPRDVSLENVAIVAVKR